MNPLGKKIHVLRLAKDWTLAELAKRSGVALSSLSRIETGRMTGTLESHLRIARALGVRLVELYADVDASGPLLEVHPGSSVTESWNAGKGVQWTPLASGALRKKIFPVLMSISQGKSASLEQGPSGSESFLYLLKGKVELTVGKQQAKLSEGQSAYFQAAHPCSLKNVGSAAALTLRVTSPPTL